MEAVKVKDLLQLCMNQVKKGNQDKIVLISDDDEGNGYHTLFYHFTDGMQFKGSEDFFFHDGQKAEDVIILG